VINISNFLNIKFLFKLSIKKYYANKFNLLFLEKSDMEIAVEKYCTGLFLCLFVVSNLNSQNHFISERNVYFSEQALEVSLDFDHYITEFYIKCNDCEISNVEYSTNGKDWIAFNQYSENEYPISSLLFLPNQSFQSLLVRSLKPQKVQFIAQHLPSFPKIYKQRDFNAFCEKPIAVLQSEWRSGLPDPKPNRMGSKTRHIILHHSGADNFRDNYTDVVRAYYLFHLQGNNWSDIGYNYLIDPDGVLYYGRDPLDSGWAQDEVTGAHFCGKNAHTMGVCLIGNYDEAIPSEASLSTLTQLIVWKVIKDDFDLFGMNPHPFPIGDLLQNFATHNQGCSTLCPGLNILAEIENLKISISEKVNACLNSQILLSEDSQIMIFPNPTKDWLEVTIENDVSLKYLKIYNEQGIEMISYKGNSNNKFIVNTGHWSSGRYTVLFILEGGWFSKKIIKF